MDPYDACRQLPIAGELGSLCDSPDPTLWMLLHSAVRASECASGVFLKGPRDNLKVVAAFNWSMEATYCTALSSRLVPNQVRVIEDIEGLLPDELDDCERIPHEAGVRFLAAVLVEHSRSIVGILIVTDPRVHSPLSPAQPYVMRMHAAQLTALSKIEPNHARDEDPATVRLRLLESVVVNANDAILVTEAEPIDLPGPRIVYCNRAFQATTGYSEAEVLGKTPRILQAEGIDRKALDRLKEALRKWQPVEVTLRNVRKDGTLFWVELSIVPVANEKGWFTHWVSVQRDVSDRKAAEEITVRVRVAEAENRAYETEIAQRKRVETRLSYEASHDHLTKLHNRAYFMERLKAALKDRRSRTDKTVLFLDLDGFKLVNDSLGHRAGDFLLVTSAKRLKDCVRPQDVVARIGGDEFAVLLPDGGLKAGIAVAERIGALLACQVPFGEQRLFISCSIGIALADANRSGPDVLLRNADIAMYEAKKRGAGGHAIFTTSMHSSVSDALKLQTDLRQAIRRNEFHLNFQAICDPRSREIKGFEALIRWQHPERGMVPPLTFIPLAEEIGLIRDIGRWVLREACINFAAWSDKHAMAGSRISVNVSGDELRHADFIPDLVAILEETQLQPTQLQLEITESVFLRYPDQIGKSLAGIRTLGVTVALDDFGTGFSSLGYIDQYPIDTIKIDRSFVTRMVTRRRTLAIVQTIIELGRALDLQIVAEGVETNEQCQLLVDLGCSRIQGYLFAKPVAGDQMHNAMTETEAIITAAEATT